MWKQFWDLVSRVFLLTQETEKNKKDIAEMRQEIKNMSAAIERIIYEMHRSHENEAHEREKMALRLEIEILKFERRLPPPA